MSNYIIELTINSTEIQVATLVKCYLVDSGTDNMMKEWQNVFYEQIYLALGNAGIR